jgi:glycerophosphoryl diester phosphodiesterase
MTATLGRTAREGRFLRVGHKGAAALAPENTLASIGAALELGVDLVEVDVVDDRGRRLVLAHSHREIEPGAVTLDEALAYFAAEASPDVGIDLDLKGHGFETELVAALRRHDLVGRAIASSFFGHGLRELRRIEPGLRTGISYPWDRHELSLRRPLWPVVVAGAATLRAALPFRIGRMASRADAGSAMLHYSVISPAVVSRCHALGLSVFAWTIDDRALLARVLATGVDGVISNDPRIFGPDGESA